MEPIRIMVIDDHPALRAGLCYGLRNESDFDIVAEACSGEEAVLLAKQLKPDVVLMDISMGGISGIEATRQIKAFSLKTAVIILSGFSYSSYLQEALSAGATGYLLKTTSMPEIIESIRAVRSGRAVFDLRAAGDVLQQVGNEKVPNGKPKLGGRQLAILKLTATGKSSKEIAGELDISERTVQAHMTGIFKKLEVNSRLEAVFRGLKEGWITINDLPDKNNR